MPPTTENNAEKRARRLLLSHLDPEQKKSFRANGSFVVVSPTNRRYLLGEEAFGGGNAYVECIEGSYKRNGHRLDATHYDIPYCVHFATYVEGDDWFEWDLIPLSDQLLAYKIMLESRKGEKHFLKEAEPMA